MSGKLSATQQLDNLADALAEDILSLTDEEIVAEVEETGATWHRYVPVDRVDAYLALGWTVDGRGPLPGIHGLFCVWMDWTGAEPREPGK